MPSMMDFPVHTALRDALNEPEGADTGWVRLYEALANDYLYPDADRLVVFAENHDTTRLLANVKGDVALFKIAMAYLTTVRGTPQFFYGSEILMEGPREREDGKIRADMPGGWAGDAKNAFTGAGLSAAERDAQDYLRRLLRWRRNTPVVQHGKLQHFAPADGVYVYFRYDGNDTVMVALNRNATSKPLALERFGRFVKAGSKGRDAISGKTVALGATLELAGNAATIISIE
jgi:glycosidase